jgi:hypothetical protein
MLAGIDDPEGFVLVDVDDTSSSDHSSPLFLADSTSATASLPPRFVAHSTSTHDDAAWHAWNGKQRPGSCGGVGLGAAAP